MTVHRFTVGWPAVALEEQSSAGALCVATAGLVSQFRDRGMKARQVIVTGRPVPRERPLISWMCGLPVGWIGPHVLRRESGWCVEMIGDDFAYGSVVVEEDGTYRPGWEPKRQWIHDRERDLVMQDSLKRLMDGLAWAGVRQVVLGEAPENVS